MKKIMLFACFVMSIMFSAHHVMAQSDVPLMVLRYNQPRIYYDKQLYNIIKKAVAIKPNLILSLVSFVPKARSESSQEGIDASAAKHLSQLVVDLRAMGIPQKSINITKDSAPDAQFHEIYIYVD